MRGFLDTMTPKQRVVKKYPDAHAYRYGGPFPWVIYSGERVNRSLNVQDKTAALAWKAAWGSIKQCSSTRTTTGK